MVVYKVTNNINGKVYIGQTIYNLDKRKRAHIVMSNSKKINKPYFNKALKKYGSDNFKWQVICICPNIDSLNEREEYYIAFYDSMNNGYNLKSGGLNNFYSEESKRKIGDGNRGKTVSKETRLKISKSIRGSKNGNYGKPMSEETKRKLSIAKMAENLSKETRRKMSDSSKGIKHSDATKEKNSKASKKMWDNPEFRDMMRKKRQALWADPIFREKTLIQLQEGRDKKKKENVVRCQE